MNYTSLKALKPFFKDRCGRLLAGGKVYTYESGTLTPKPTFKDPAGQTENTNPIILDASGEAEIYINSDYRFQIFSRDNVLIDDFDSIASTQRISSTFLSDPSGLTQDQINAAKEDKLNKGVSNGYASLDENAKVPDEQISVIDNLTTDDAKKPVSAKQAKLLQDNKLDANKRGAVNGVASLDENKKVPVAELPNATSSAAGVMKLINSLTAGGTDAALTAEQGKLFFAMFSGGANYFKIPNPSDPNKPWIVQCGSFSANVPTGSTPSTQQVTFGLVFPNSCVHVSGNFTIGINAGFLSHTCESKTSTGFNLRALTGAAAGVKIFDYVAIGN